jgi:hypothetical protein
MCAFVLMVVVFQVFKWGHDKEQRGERTDFMGRPNNHPGKEKESNRNYSTGHPGKEEMD